MKNITLSAPKELIDAERQAAEQDGTTLNNEFRAWLAKRQATRKKAQVARFEAMLTQTRPHLSLHGPYSRDEMNER